jgi:plant cysteine oxidase
VSVRRRVQADVALLRRLLAACRVAFLGPGTVPAPADVSLVRGILGTNYAPPCPRGF